jgi:hypothetical protein
MATKLYCDHCGKQIKGNYGAYQISLFRHITNENPLLNQHVRFENGKMQPISGMANTYDFCLDCYNEKVYPFWDTIKDGINSNKEQEVSND